MLFVGVNLLQLLNLVILKTSSIIKFNIKRIYSRNNPNIVDNNILNCLTQGEV